MCSVKRDVLKKFANFTGKHLCWSLFLKRDSNTGLFLWNLLIFKNIYFQEHLQTTASVVGKLLLGVSNQNFRSNSQGIRVRREKMISYKGALIRKSEISEITNGEGSISATMNVTQNKQNNTLFTWFACFLKKFTRKTAQKALNMC